MKRAMLDKWSAMRAAFAVLRGETGTGLPEQVELYIVGKVEQVPARDLAVLPPGFIEVLRVLRAIGQDDEPTSDELRELLDAKVPADGAPRPAPRQMPKPAPRPFPRLAAAHFEPAQHGAVLTLADEVRIELLRAGSGIVRLTGTRAQLEAEGVTPPKWPARGNAVGWTRDSLSFRLERCRRRGLMANAGGSGDWWSVVIDAPGSARADLTSVRRLRRELKAAEYHASEAGQRAAEWQRMCLKSAGADAGFQSFLAAVLPPGIKQMRARTPKACAGRAIKEGGAA